MQHLAVIVVIATLVGALAALGVLELVATPIEQPKLGSIRLPIEIDHDWVAKRDAWIAIGSSSLVGALVAGALCAQWKPKRRRR